MRKAGPKPLSPAKRKALALRYLSKNRLITLATGDASAVWSATVFFAYDKDCNIIFYSRPDTRHSRFIARNGRAAIVVNHHQKKGSVCGMQIAGTARLLTGKMHEKYYRLYRARFPWADDFKADHRLYFIKPKEIWYIDEKFFGHFFRVRLK